MVYFQIEYYALRAVDFTGGMSMLIKRTFCILLAAVFTLALPCLSLAASQEKTVFADGDSGETVLRIQIRLRELGYLPYRPTGVYRAMTVEAVKAFQERCGSYGTPLAVDGRVGPESMKRLFDPNAPRVRIPDSVHMPRGPVSAQLAEKGALIAWSEIKPKLKSGAAYTAIDCNTGERFRLVFIGGENHAEMELYSAEDKQAFDTVCGEEYNFLKRPIVVEVNGERAAASMQCMPHGSGTVSTNGMDGHICVFFSGSLSHVANVPDIEHESIIRQAAGQ